jgi:hypothetical protein
MEPHRYTINQHTRQAVSPPPVKYAQTFQLLPTLAGSAVEVAGNIRVIAITVTL